MCGQNPKEVGWSEHERHRAALAGFALAEFLNKPVLSKTKPLNSRFCFAKFLKTLFSRADNLLILYAFIWATNEKDKTVLFIKKELSKLCVVS